MKEKCSCCSYWKFTEENILMGKKTKSGLCRRNTPNGVDGRAKWPTTNEYDWCGEFNLNLLVEG